MDEADLLAVLDDRVDLRVVEVRQREQVLALAGVEVDAAAQQLDEGVEGVARDVARGVELEEVVLVVDVDEGLVLGRPRDAGAEQGGEAEQRVGDLVGLLGRRVGTAVCIDRPVVVASEYERLTTRWIQANCPPGSRFVRSYGATEAFPPEDADCIVDNTATGDTLRANQLRILGELMRSSTRLYASQRAWADADRRARIEDLALLLRSVLEARGRVLVEINIDVAGLAGLVEVLPCMREPTISLLHGNSGYAVKVAVRRDQLPALIPKIRARGGTDIVVSSPAQIVP